MTELNAGREALAAPEQAPVSTRTKVGAAVLMVAALMDLLDATIVNVALPSIQRGLQAGPTSIEWVVSGYMLAFAATLIAAGRLGDLVGRRRVFLVGVVGFGSASLVCGIAQTPTQLVVARIVQGTAAAVLMPQVLASYRTMFTGRQRTNAYAVYGAVAGLAAALGVILGGALTQADLFGLGWRVVFLVNVPIALAVVVLALVFVPESRSDRHDRLDLLGAGVLAAALVAIVYPLLEGQRLGWPAWCFLLVAAGLALLVTLWLVEDRRRRTGIAPVLEPDLFRVPAFSAGIGVQALFGVGLQGFSLVLALWLQLGHTFGPLHAGVTMIAFSVGAVITAPMAGGLAVRLGRSVLIAGAAVMALGMVAIAIAAGAGGGWVSTWGLAPGMLLGGAGLGLLVVPLVNVVLAAVPGRSAGGASGIFSTAQQLGGAIGVAVVGSVFFSRLPTEGFDSAFRHAIPYVIGACVLSGVLCLLLPKTAVSEMEAAELM